MLQSSDRSLIKSIFTWHRSIYSLVWPEALVYSIIYTLLTLLYRIFLSTTQKEVFERVVLYAAYTTELVPLGLLLGFYVSALFIIKYITARETKPDLHRLAFAIRSSVRSAIMRKSLARHILLSWLLRLIHSNPCVQRRFSKFASGENSPTLRLLQGIKHDRYIKKYFPHFITKKEAIFLEDASASGSGWWTVPLVWADQIVAIYTKSKAQREFQSNLLQTEMSRFVEKIGMEITSSVPVSYTQVTTIAMYSYFLLHILASQFVERPNRPIVSLPQHKVDIYIPVTPLIQIILYVGWFKVGQNFLNYKESSKSIHDYINKNIEKTWRLSVQDDILLYKETNLQNEQKSTKPSSVHSVFLNDSENAFTFEDNTWQLINENQSKLKQNTQVTERPYSTFLGTQLGECTEDMDGRDISRSPVWKRAVSESAAAVTEQTGISNSAELMSLRSSGVEYIPRNLINWSDSSDENDGTSLLQQGCPFPNYKTTNVPSKPKNFQRISDSRTSRKSYASITSRGAVSEIGSPVLVSASISPVKLYGNTLRQLDDNVISPGSASTSRRPTPVHVHMPRNIPQRKAQFPQANSHHNDFATKHFPYYSVRPSSLYDNLQTSPETELL